MLLKSNRQYQQMSKKQKIAIEKKIDKYVDINTQAVKTMKIASELLDELFYAKELKANNNILKFQTNVWKTIKTMILKKP